MSWPDKENNVVVCFTDREKYNVPDICCYGENITCVFMILLYGQDSITRTLPPCEKNVILKKNHESSFIRLELHRVVSDPRNMLIIQK